MKFLYSLLSLFLVSTYACFSQSPQQIKTIDSLIALSNSETISNKESLDLALEAQRLANNIQIDSITLKTNHNLASMYYYNDKIGPYIQTSRRNLELAKKLDDSLIVVKTSLNLGSQYRLNQINDSSYFFYNETLKYLTPSINPDFKVEALYMLADLQHVGKVYDGAEQDAIKALRTLEELPENQERLETYWGVYNLLAIISKDVGNYEKSISYYDQSIDYASRLKEGRVYQITSINNKANVYREMGQYEKALDLYNNILSQNNRFQDEDPSFYGNVINNIALTKIASGNYNFKEVESQLKQAISIADKEQDANGELNATLDLSKLYLNHKAPDSVKKYANRAYNMAEDYSSNEAKQRALFLLAKVTNGEEGKGYLLEHIRLGDSLDAVERTVRNKMARIKFDSEQLEAKNEQITKERLYLFILSVGLLLTGVLIYIILSQRAKNKELRLNKLQQEANEEIYNLMLNQQDKVEEARAEEKIRVSKELHDGVLGRLFGIRLSLDSLNLSNTTEATTSRGNYIEQLKLVEQEIRKISHELNMDFVAGSGFEDILNDLVETQSKAYGLKVHLEVSDDIAWDEVTNKVKINIYRIVQESMQNVYKHAAANNISIGVLLKNSDICLRIVDDGKGFDVQKQRKGIGLKNLNSRVAELNGTLDISSSLNKGTQIAIKIPQQIS